MAGQYVDSVLLARLGRLPKMFILVVWLEPNAPELISFGYRQWL